MRMYKLLPAAMLAMSSFGISPSVFAENSQSPQNTSQNMQVESLSNRIPLIAIDALDSQNKPLTNAVVEIVPDGSTQPTFITNTDNNGQVFIFYPMSASDYSTAKSNGGYLNYWVVVSKTGEPVEVYHAFRNINQVSNVRQLQSISTSSDSFQNLKTGLKGVQLRPNSQQPTDWPDGLRQMQTANPYAEQAISPNDLPCTYYTTGSGSSSTTAWTIIGELHNASDSIATFTYGKSADSTIGTALSTSGNGGWSANGSAQISNSNSGSISYQRNSSQWHDDGHQILTQFTYQLSHWVNGCGGSYYTTSASQWVGGGEIGADTGAYDGMSANYTSYRTAYQPGFTFNTSSSSAQNYSIGVTLPWGASLSAQSGYSTFVAESWVFSSSAGYTQYLYGLNAKPINAPVIYAD